MSLNKGIRKFHRWMSVAFTLAFLVTFTANLQGEPVEWVNYLPLPPLFLLFFTGLYLFALPHVSRWRGRASVE